MAHILVDRVKETTTTTGTGTLSLLGAVAQFRAFSSVMANNDTTLYAIVGQTGTEWEVGVGTWTTGNNLARTTILASSNAGAVVTLSAGTKNVFMTLTLLGEWPTLKLREGAAINWDNSDVTLTQSGNTLTVAGGELVATGGAQVDGMLVGQSGTSPVDIELGINMNDTPIREIGGGTTTVPPMEFIAGTLMTTPSDGAIEHDATNFYGTTDAGNRGILPVVNFIRAAATRTYTSNATSQPVFNSPANGRITLETGTYTFRATLHFGAMSATNGNRSIDILGAGTATVTNPRWIALGLDGTGGTSGAAAFNMFAAVGSGTSVITATVGTSLGLYLAGNFELTVAGTMIPSTTMVTAAASNLGIGSFWEIQRTGATGRISVGQWD